jgi:hypothetical protein
VISEVGGMPKKQIGKRPRAGSKPHRGKSVLNPGLVDSPIEPRMLSTIKMWSLFRRMIGTTSRDIRSFQIYITKSGYYTVYLKDSATSAPRS